MMIKKISMALHESGEPGYNAIPDDSFAVSQYLELYGMSADIADFERFISFDYAHTLMTIQYSASSLQEVEALLLEISEILQEEPLPYIVGGSSLIDKEISQSVKTGQYYSLLFAFVAILLLLSLIFRSFTAGLIGSLPLVFAVFCTFGLMGWIGIELNIVTALLSSISIGLGVDFTIHVFWRLKSELLQTNDWQEAIGNTIRSIGRGITINAFSVMLGFSVLFLSAFPLIQSFAFLIIISLLLCLISALALVPALCLILKPKFLIVTSHRSPDTSLQSEVR
jgi:predicted RND superfamily exporter protein